MATGLDWAGLLIEAVDGRPPDAFVRDEILAPLGIDETVFEVPDPSATAWPMPGCAPPTACNPPTLRRSRIPSSGASATP